MKKILILLLLGIVSSGNSLYAAVLKDTIMTKYILIHSDENNEDFEDPPHGFRLPQYEVPCSINPLTGVHLKGEGQIDILLYEIWDSNGTCILSLDNEEDFLDIFFKLSGEYEIRLITEDYTYIGIIRI